MWFRQRLLAAQAPGWKSAKHTKQWGATLKKFAYPVIGTLDVAAIDNGHVLQILQPIWTTKTETATRVRGRIESILDWARHKGYRTGENPSRWEGNLEHDLPCSTKLKRRKHGHHPALPYMRVGAFMFDLRTRDCVSASALEWGILTSTRYQEIAGARRCEVDLELRRWTIPPERMKLLFRASEGGMISNATLGALIDEMHEADLRRGGIGYLDPSQNRIATQHGFRSTFKDWAAEVGLFEREISEHALAHRIKDKAEAAYQRGPLLQKRAALMQQWAKFCAQRVPQLPTASDFPQRLVA